ncbi:MAG: PH domain-containing protein [Corynebacterium sp.]|uniref:PH domain-containing protein n=1 Tax=Corynebacterium sp. TaxID=1720 RepID=UPI0026DD7F44|nr:PH domain-containing protein [Corynebacterium sp.]MDO5099746.1 PH domain-containing protein [Corynebacterium sp.]
MTEDKQRVHFLTPVLRAWSVIFALGLFAVTTFGEQTVELIRKLLSSDMTETLQALGIIAAIVAIGGAASIWWWKATSYTVTDHDVTFRRGVFNQKIRSARLDRTQAIDVVQPFHARIFGLAAVRIETAGGHNSRIEIGYLRRPVAQRLKERLLGEEEAGQVIVHPIPVWRTLVSSMCSISAVISLASVLLTVGFELSVATLLPIFLGTIPNIWRTIDGSFRFTARQVGDTINVSYGLANLQRKTLDIRRAHAVSMKKPALWRPFGWWRVQVVVAGYGERLDGMTVLPVGDKHTAMALCDILMGYQLDPETPAQPQYRSPKTARWVSPVDWSKQAFELTETLAIEHRGRVGKKAAIAFRRHIQELTVRTGPIQRLVGVATVRMHLVRGPVKLTGRDLTLSDAWHLMAEVDNRAGIHDSIPSISDESPTV